MEKNSRTKEDKFLFVNQDVPEVISCKDIYQDFNKKYAPKKYGVIIKRGSKQRLPFSVYKKIIMTYFEIYFRELYFFKKPMYFLFGGRLHITRLDLEKQVPFVAKQQVIGVKKFINLLWMNHPKHAKYVNFIKLTGSTNKIPVIERDNINSINIEQIPFTSEVTKKTY